MFPNETAGLGFDFFKHPVYSYGLKVDLIVRLELNSSKSRAHIFFSQRECRHYEYQF